MRILTYIFLILLLVFGVSFAVLNSGQVALNYFFGAEQISLSLLLVFTLGLGIVFGFIFTMFPVIKLKKENYRLKSRIKIVEQEVENLRSLPIKGE